MRSVAALTNDRPMQEPNEAPARIRELGEFIASAVESMTPAAFHARSGPDAWSAAEVAGHASEFPVTFATQALALSNSPGMKLGRQLDDPGRLAAVARLGDATPAQAAEMVREATRQSAALVEQITPVGWDVAGTRLVNGEPFTVRQVIEMLIVDHLAGHLAQLGAT